MLDVALSKHFKVVIEDNHARKRCCGPSQPCEPCGSTSRLVVAGEPSAYAYEEEFGRAAVGYVLLALAATSSKGSQNLLVKSKNVWVSHKEA